jgi:putative nucleotidyltransferase with HDIG domain
METTSSGSTGVRFITEFVDELVIALINSRIYWSEHPRVLDSIHQLRKLLPQFISDTSDNVLRLGVVAEYFVYQQRPLLGASLSAPRLIESILDRGAGGLEFDAKTTQEDFQKLFELFSRPAIDSENYTAVNQRLKDRGCSHIRLLPPYRPEERKTGATSSPTDHQQVANEASPKTLVPVELYQGVVKVLQDTTVLVCHGGIVQFDDARASIDRVLYNLETDTSSIFGLSRYERYDAFTFGHSIRVSLLALQLARALTTDKDLLNRVGVAALLHDVGKAHVPFEVLHCKTRLTPEQQQEMRKHPVYGAEILLDHHDCDPMAYTAAFGHHMSDRSQGYPKTLHEQRLSFVTKIIKICDVYEALTAIRPYKPAMSSVRALRIMMSMTGVFDLPLLRLFIEVTGAFPTGTFVRMTSGEVARVRDQTGQIQMPVVELLTDPDGQLLDEWSRNVVDLSRPGDKRKIQVAETLVDARLEDFTAQA